MRSFRILRSLAVRSASSLLPSASAAALFVVFAGCSSGSSPTGTPSADAGGDTGPTTGMQCPASTGAGTDVSTSPSTDTTFTAEGSPYRIDFSLDVPSDVTLTLAPCAVLLMGDGASITVDGKLVSAGVAGKPVTIQRHDPTKSWGWIDANKQNKLPALDLSYTVLSGGGHAGSPAEQSSVVRVRGNGSGEAPVEMIRVDHLEIDGSDSVGLIALESATFTADSQALTIKGSKLEPLVTHVGAVSNLPDGDLTGNGVDVITLTTSERLGTASQAIDATMHKRSVPYRVGYFGDVQGSTLLISPHQDTDPASRLTIEAGVTVRFALGSGLEVDRDASDAAKGSLIVNGTADMPVTFTSDAAAPAAGDWFGILLRGAPKDDTKLDHVVIAYAGSEPTTTSGFSCGTPPAMNKGEIKGALQFATGKGVTRQLLTNSAIEHSASNGVDRGWAGSDVDYLATNTFKDIRYCAQTQNRDAMSQCPMSPTCPTAP